MANNLRCLRFPMCCAREHAWFLILEGTSRSNLQRAAAKSPIMNLGRRSIRCQHLLKPVALLGVSLTISIFELFPPCSFACLGLVLQVFRLLFRRLSFQSGSVRMKLNSVITHAAMSSVAMAGPIFGIEHFYAVTGLWN